MSTRYAWVHYSPRPSRDEAVKWIAVVLIVTVATLATVVSTVDEVSKVVEVAVHAMRTRAPHPWPQASPVHCHKTREGPCCGAPPAYRVGNTRAVTSFHIVEVRLEIDATALPTLIVPPALVSSPEAQGRREWLSRPRGEGDGTHSVSSNRRSGCCSSSIVASARSFMAKAIPSADSTRTCRRRATLSRRLQ